MEEDRQIQFELGKVGIETGAEVGNLNRRLIIFLLHGDVDRPIIERGFQIAKDRLIIRRQLNRLDIGGDRALVRARLVIVDSDVVIDRRHEFDVADFAHRTPRTRKGISKRRR